MILAGGFSQKTAKKIHERVMNLLHANGADFDTLIKIFNNKNKINAGDAIIAIPSSGVHSNGFSLVRKVFDVEKAEELLKKMTLNEKVGQLAQQPLGFNAYTRDENGEIVSGTWNCTVTISMDNLKAFGKDVENVTIVMDNTITL